MHVRGVFNGAITFDDKFLMPASLQSVGVKRVLNIRPDRIDFRDREYRPPVHSLPPSYPDKANRSEYLEQFTSDQMILDQKSEGACTGFALAAVINFILWSRARQTNSAIPKRVSPHMLYNNARLYDEWDGEDYEGSSCRGAMKGCLLYTSPSPRDKRQSRMPSSA